MVLAGDYPVTPVGGEEAGPVLEPVVVDAMGVIGVERLDARALLSEARAALAKRQLASARKSIRTALAQRLSAGQRAEAGTLLAEAAFIEGRMAEATALYLRVSERYRGLSAGQNALYAAARLAAKRGNKAVARKLFQRYVKRYPRGRFQTEAARNLLRLSE